MNVPTALLNCLSTSCCESECECPIGNLKSQVSILEMNCAKAVTNKKGRICDCGILWNNQPRFAVVELKGGVKDLDLNKLVNQIQGGLDLLDQYLTHQVVEDFFPILLYRGRRDPTAALNKKVVKFRTLTRNIIAKPCGTDLSTILGMRSRNKGRGRRNRRGSRR